MNINIYEKIAMHSAASYKAMLAIPEFARHARKDDYKTLNNYIIYKPERYYGHSTWLFHVQHNHKDCPAYEDFHCQIYYKFGKLHRDNDQPAIIEGDDKRYYKNGIEYFPNI